MSRMGFWVPPVVAAAPSGPSLVAGYNHFYDFTDAAQVTSSGGAISAIADKGSSAVTLSQTTAGNKPGYGSTTQNGYNTATFNTSQQLIGNSTSDFAFLHHGAATLFVVYKQTATYAGTNLYPCGTNFASTTNEGIAHGCFDFGAGLDAWVYTNTNGGNVTNLHDAAPERASYAQVWVAVAVTFDSSAGDTLHMSNSGATGSWTGSSYTASGSSASAGYFALGAGGSLGETDVRNGFGGEIAMLITYPSVLSGTDVNSNLSALVSYFAL